MKLGFNTKEESNKIREEQFLSLTPSQRVLAFFKLTEQINKFPTRAKKSNDNFIISFEK